MEQITINELHVAFTAVVQNLYVQLFLLAVFFDILSGYYKAFRCKNIESRKGLDGLVKHLLIAAMVVTIYPYLRLLGLERFGTAVVWAYIVMYATSIIENLQAVGAKLPDKILNVLSQANKKDYHKQSKFGIIILELQKT